MAEKKETTPIKTPNTLESDSDALEAKVEVKQDPKATEEPKPKHNDEPASPDSSSPDTPEPIPSIATIDRMRAREDTPVRLEPQSIGKIRSPNFAQFRSGLSSSASSARKIRQDLEMSGTPRQTPIKNRYAPTVDQADFELDICAKIGAIKWDSDDD